MYIKGRFDKNTLILTTNYHQVILKRSYLSYISNINNANIIIDKDIEKRLEIKTEYLFTQNQRLLIYCVEYSTATPIPIAGRSVYTIDIINPHFWCWYTLEKPTNVLNFFYRFASTYDDGLVVEEDSLPVHSELILNLFYK